MGVSVSARGAWHGLSRAAPASSDSSAPTCCVERVECFTVMWSACEVVSSGWALRMRGRGFAR